MDLTAKSSFNELQDYAILCLEHGVKKVVVNKETHRRLKQLVPFSSSNGVRFLGIYFTIKN